MTFGGMAAAVVGRVYRVPAWARTPAPQVGVYRVLGWSGNLVLGVVDMADGRHKTGLDAGIAGYGAGG